MDLQTAVLWRTPTANDAKNSLSDSQFGRGTLTAHVVEFFWPTPQSRDWKTGWPEGATKKGRQKSLNDCVLVNWPTPGTSGLSNGTGNCIAINKIYTNGKISDEERRSMRSGSGGQLNADWVERLMGYPDSWTDIDANNVNIANRYPAAWIDGSWDNIPKVITSQKYRRSRLKALGNAIVPQIAESIWKLIKGVCNEYPE
jgi:site-specific DNA-cytosine methylase